MKVINPDTGFLAYQKILSNLQANHFPVVVWQVHPDSGERSINESRLNSFHMESKLLHFDLAQGLKVDRNLPLYFYAEEGQIIFKSTVHEIRENVFSVDLPSEIKLLDDSEKTEVKKQIGKGANLNNDVQKVKGGTTNAQVGGFMRVKSMAQRSARDKNFLSGEFSGSLDEEDKLYADQRENPRARPKAEKLVRVRLANTDEVHRLKLFDLSVGGMGFITQYLHIFPKGTDIFLLGIDGHELDDPLVGKIMSHRAVDETEVEWKVGIKFDEGQD